VLLVATASGDGDGLLEGLRGRTDLRILRASTEADALAKLRERAVRLVLASPALDTAAVTALLAARERLRPDLPVLVVRNRQAEEPEGWVERGVGVLRCPLLPGALGRSVDVVLGLRSEMKPNRRDPGSDGERRG
jgi:hypothetical protein